MTCPGRSTAVALAVAGAAATLAGCGGSEPSDESGTAGPNAIVESSSGPEGPFAGIEINPPYRLPSATLTDAEGDSLSLPDDLDAPVRLFFFGYTQCPDVCPLIMSNLALAAARLPADVADDVEVVLVTSDPARDDPAAIKAYLERYDPEFTGLTGDLDTITSVGNTMGVPIEKGTRLPSGGYTVDHGAQVVGYVGDQGVVVWTAEASVDDFAADMVTMATQAAAEAAEAGGEG